MRTRHLVIGGLLLVSVVGGPRLVAHPSTVARGALSNVEGQDPQDEIRSSTMRPVVRGRT